MKPEDLSPEMQEKAEGCEGVELSEEDLDAIAGGISTKKKVHLHRRLLKKTRPQPQLQPQPQPQTQPQTNPESVLPTVDPLADTESE